MTTPAEIAEFIRVCRESTLTERSGSQSHFIALCRLLGLRSPLEEDPRGEWFTFEKGARKTGGGEVVAALTGCGFRYVTVDLHGYRMGSLNRC